jgi:two-component system, sensor histidine kinase and response regulator
VTMHKVLKTYKNRAGVVLAIARARSDLDRALAQLEVMAVDDHQRVSYSVHAFNNYLMVVSTTVQLLQTKFHWTSDRDTKRWLASLSHATNLMMSTARGVLTAAPDEIPPLLLEPASLAEIAETVCASYREIAHRKRVRLICRSSKERDQVVTDRVAAAAVLDNLLSNAVKYTPAGTTVKVTTITTAREVLCSVRDCGPGFSVADQANLYQRGVRLSAQPTAGESSTGYGLAIAHDLATALNGQLSCTSTLGEGACFRFSLPLATELESFEHAATMNSMEAITANA